MTKRLRDFSIRNKLRAFIILVSLLLLVFACGILMISESYALKQQTEKELITLAAIIADSNISGLTFNDPFATEENLLALRQNPSILFAHVLRADGDIFANYFRHNVAGQTIVTADWRKKLIALIQETVVLRTPYTYFLHDSFSVIHPMIFQDKLEGYIYIRADLNVFFGRLYWYVSSIIVVIFLSLILAFFLAEYFQRIFTTPIYNLLATMRLVAERKDYSLQAEKIANDELGQLVEGFNRMLAQIKSRDMELVQYHNHLEEMVNKRTLELAEARDEALAANRAKSTFLANMSHELRTPLNGILGYTQILERDKSLTTKQREGIHVIQRSGDYLLTLVNDILDISKLDAGRIQLQPFDFNFSEFLNNLVQLFQIRASDKQIAFSYRMLSELPRGLYADEKRLRQILINLLSNAVKFTEKGGVIFSVRAEPIFDNAEYQRLYFLVEDTGIGMDALCVENLFSAFQQGSDYLTKKAEGTGLGLAITQKLVEFMGGTIEVSSTLNKGSLFTVILPLKLASHIIELQDDNSNAIVGYEGNLQSLLVVDDQPENIKLLVDLLKPLGFEVLIAKNGQEALQIVESHHLHAILTDLVMPIMDGFELARRIRKIPNVATCPIIAISASLLASTDCYQPPYFTAILNKPVQIDDLLEELRKNLNLTWVYGKATKVEVTAAVKHKSDNLAGEEFEPPIEIIELLYELAMMGDINGIIIETDKLERTMPQCAGFASKIRDLAKSFDEETLFSLLERYIKKTSISVS